MRVPHVSASGHSSHLRKRVSLAHGNGASGPSISRITEPIVIRWGGRARGVAATLALLAGDQIVAFQAEQDLLEKLLRDGLLLRHLGDERGSAPVIASQRVERTEAILGPFGEIPQALSIVAQLIMLGSIAARSDYAARDGRLVRPMGRLRIQILTRFGAAGFRVEACRSTGLAAFSTSAINRSSSGVTPIKTLPTMKCYAPNVKFM
jgi:hypothetical protein